MYMVINIHIEHENLEVFNLVNFSEKIICIGNDVYFNIKNNSILFFEFVFKRK